MRRDSCSLSLGIHVTDSIGKLGALMQEICFKCQNFWLSRLLFKTSQVVWQEFCVC